MKKKYSILSLFTGCGGLDLGLLGGFIFLNKEYKKHNFDIAWANDIDANACSTFSKNFHHGIVCGDNWKCCSPCFWLAFSRSD